MKIMKEIILLLSVFTLGLSASADYSFTTTQPLYSPSVPYQNYQANQAYQYPQYSQYAQTGYNQTIQPVDYSATQPYAQTYNNQAAYQNPYLAQCQGQYANPYQYRRPYGYGVGNSIVPGLANTTGNSGVVKNIVQSMLYSKLRGY